MCGLYVKLIGYARPLMPLTVGTKPSNLHSYVVYDPRRRLSPSHAPSVMNLTGSRLINDGAIPYLRPRQSICLPRESPAPSRLRTRLKSQASFRAKSRSSFQSLTPAMHATAGTCYYWFTRNIQLARFLWCCFHCLRFYPLATSCIWSSKTRPTPPTRVRSTRGYRE